jgi:hypothetical protein
VATLTGLFLTATGLAWADARRAEVVVYGGTASGVIAAVAAAREGKTVLLIEPGRHVGGMVSGGLGATDTGNRKAIGGYAREFFDRVWDHYHQVYGPDSTQLKDCSDGFRFEPKVAETLFHAMLDEAQVTVLLERPLTEVRRVGPRIESLVSNQDIYSGTVFIDTSYEGDLLARAGVSYTVGRESRAQYGESLAGVQLRSAAHQWPMPVSPFDDQGRLLSGVQPGPTGVPGEGDRKVQAYNYRVCMTDVAANRVPFPKPANYDPNRFELLARYLEKKPELTVGQLMHPVRIPNGKTDTNNNGPFSTDHIGGNWDYPDGDGATRARIVQDHLDYSQGFFHFLANDPRVPAKLRAEMNQWGLAKDEFVDTRHWPHQLYVREARRMIGAYVMKQSDIMESRAKPDSVGLGSYNTDSHHVQRVPTTDGAVINEGDFQVRVDPYAIPYRSLLPKPEQCVNLLVPVCLSASHVAYGTIRMEPVYMILGQASGVAAGLACSGKLAVQTVPIADLQRKLKEQGAILEPAEVPVPPRSAAPSALDPASLEGVVVDDNQAWITGDWRRSTSVGPFVGQGYLHDANENKRANHVRFTPTLPKSGRYEVRLYSTPNPNRASNVPVIVHHGDGEQKLIVDQRKPRPGGQPIVLGRFPFVRGQAGWVEIRTDDTNGHVIADAVAFVLVP